MASTVLRKRKLRRLNLEKESELPESVLWSEFVFPLLPVMEPRGFLLPILTPTLNPSLQFIYGFI